MSRRQPLELFSFRRAFTLMLLLVVLPSAVLSGFGVLAIINERAAVEKRLETVWGERLLAAEPRVLELLRGLEARPTDSGLELWAPGGRPASSASFTIERGIVGSADARVVTAVTPLAAALGNLGPGVLFASVSDPAETFLIAAQSVDGRVLGARVDGAAVQALLAPLSPSGDPAHFELKAVRQPSTDGVLARLVSGVQEAQKAARGEPRELSSRPMRAPLQDFRLVAVVEGEDPVVQASFRNRLIYSVLLGVFFLTLVLGVIITARTLYREARLSRLKTDFVSLVSHELKTPLTSIRMFIETLEMGRVHDEKESKEVLGLLSVETARLSELIERVLDWARIESGRRRYDVAVVPAREIAERAADAFRTQRLGAPLSFAADIPELPTVEVDKEALVGALLNLLQNAYKYSPGEKRVELTAAAREGEVTFSVRDFGIGIAPRERKRVFERFYRVDNLLTRSTEGTGLGLPIARRIVEAHGGRISLESSVGHGSTFTIHLPTAEP